MTTFAGAVLALAAATYNTASRADSLAGTTDQRSAQVLQEWIRHPAVSPRCDRPGNAAGRCEWGQLGLALALLQQDPSSTARARANQLLAETARHLPVTPGWKRLANPQDPAASALTDAAMDFPFLTATLVFRIIRLFGQEAPVTAPRLLPEVQASLRRLFQDWSLSGCKVADADPALVWRPWGSENHDIQRAHACWAAALLAQQDRFSSAIRYEDGSDADGQRTVWTHYLTALLAARALHGGPVEFFSPTYSKYFLSVVYNIRDFADDAALRGTADRFLTLWWASWAQEQEQGFHGGSEARAYPGARAQPDSGLGWLYLGSTGWRGGINHPAILPMLTSSYRPPEIVRAIARYAGAPYEAWSRPVSLAAGRWTGARYDLAPNQPGLVRYSYRTQGFVMGASIAPRLPVDRWAQISSQNRWNGVAMTDGPEARVEVSPAPQGGRSHYNAVLAAQSRGLQIVQKILPPFSRGAGQMVIRIGPGLETEEENGWILVRGSAYVAVRPAFGGYARIEGQGFQARLLEQTSPVIIQAAPRSDFDSFYTFRAAIQQMPVRVSGEDVEVQGLGRAGRLRVFLSGASTAELDGAKIRPPDGWIFHSPWIKLRHGERTVELKVGEKDLRLDFSH
ncbi:hypothetical protein [Roseomonas chloroacetimidivorans]|uniref:hypothetical protein n=1 Tax=Roseomonas chloroacetimidivorans TaxID=1766656 RepID=UPI003C7107AF